MGGDSWGEGGLLWGVITGRAGGGGGGTVVHNMMYFSPADM